MDLNAGVVSEPILRIQNLSISYRVYGNPLIAVDDVSLELKTGEIHALVGESGCGKSTLGLSLSRLLPENRVIYFGKIIYKGKDLLALEEKEMQRYRGTEIATIFQEPMTALDPVYTVGEQIAEAIAVSKSRSAIQRKFALSFRRTSLQKFSKLYSETIRELLNRVRISNPERVVQMYPHELSGGMKQRVMIAMALAEQPSLLIADEATTALDVTTQAQILFLLKLLTKEFNMATLLITHDLGLVSAIADAVSVMYAGKIIENARTQELFERPKHPYSTGLLQSFPKGNKSSQKLVTIPGRVPPLGFYPPGCRFYPRCQYAFQKCSQEMPRLLNAGSEHDVACYLFETGK